MLRVMGFSSWICLHVRKNGVMFSGGFFFCFCFFALLGRGEF